MRIAYNPSTEPLASAPLNNDITIDLAGKTIYARGVKVGGASYGVFLKHTSTSGGGYDGLVPAPPYITTTTTRYLTDTGEWKTLNFVDTYNKTEIDDLISGAKTYTDTKIAALINGAPETLDTLKEISDYLQDSTVVGGLLDLFKKYLPLSGGTITGQGADFLTINRTDGSNSVIKFNNNGTFLGRLGYNLNGAPIVQVDGKYQSIIHSGNISSYAITSTTLNDFPRLNGTSPSGASATGTWAINISGSANRLEEIVVTDLNSAPADRIFTMASRYGSTDGNKPTTYWVSGITFRMAQNSSYRTQLCTSDDDHLYYRAEHAGSWNPWKTIAFTDSTVASATKLSTPRTIWGQSFDGSGDVNGAIALLDNTSTLRNVVEYRAGNLHFGYDTASASVAQDTYINGKTVYLRYRGYATGLILNSSGNVTIGSSDLAGTGAKLYVDGRAYTNIAFLFNSDVGIWRGSHYTGALASTDIAYNAIKHVFYGNVGIGTTIVNYKLHVNGKVASTGFVKSDSSDSYVLLGDGGHKAISDFLLKSELANQELNNNLTTITKTLTVTKDWMDTGIKHTDLTTGTYAVQVYSHATNNLIYYGYWSGIMTWYGNSTNSSEADEILLHRGAHAYNDNTIYLRTLNTTSTDGRHMRLQIAANKNFSSATYTFKFKKLI